MPDAKCDTPERVLAEARTLLSLPVDLVGARLEALRSRYRETPLLFSGETVQLLRQAAERSRRSAADDGGERALAALKEVFGYAAFRAGQLEIIQAVLAGRDCLGVMPTGAGKSVTYQIPARLLGGVTLVISPLISLMKDQVDAMGEVGIRATFLNSSLEAAERSRARAAQLRRRRVRAALRGARGHRRVGRPAARLARPAAGRRRRGALHQRVGPRLPPVLPQPVGPEAALRGPAGARADRDRHAARQGRHHRAARRCGSARGPRLVLPPQPAPVRRQEGPGRRRCAT